MRLRELRTDPAREREGVWQQWVGDVRLRIRRAGNPDYNRAFSDGLRPHRALIRADALPAETMERVQRRAVAVAVLVGWEGIQDDETGEPIPYSVERAEEVLSDPGLHDLYEFVVACSVRMENYRLEEREEDLGNSSSSSSGTASGDRSRGSSGRSSGEEGQSQPSSESPSSRNSSVKRGKPSATTSTEEVASARAT